MAFEDLAYAADSGRIQRLDIDVTDPGIAPALSAGSRPACDLQRFETVVCGPGGHLRKGQAWECCGQEAELHLNAFTRLWCTQLRGDGIFQATSQLFPIAPRGSTLMFRW